MTSEKTKTSQINYFTIILNDLEQLIDQFLDLSNDSLLQLLKCKDIIIKFDKLRSDMLVKVKSAAQNQSLTPDKTNFLNTLFGFMRFILTRFGRAINFFDSYQSSFKRKQYTSRPSSKQPPAIRKIQQQESLIANEDSSQRRGSIGSSSSYSSTKNQYSFNSSDMQQVNNIMSSPQLTSFPKDQKDYFFKKKVDIIKEVFQGLTLREKQVAMERYMNLLTNKWREEYEEERKQTVPLIICRMCRLQFYADKEKQHSQYCIEKINKMNQLPKIHQKFLELSNKLTECMLHIEKANQFNTPRLPNQSRMSLLNTPTLKRRSPLIPMLFQPQEVQNSEIHSEPATDLPQIPPLTALNSDPITTNDKMQEFQNDGQQNPDESKQNQEVEQRSKPIEMKPLPQGIDKAKITNLVPKLNLSKLPSIPDLNLQHSSSQSTSQSQNPQNLLLKYSAKQPTATTTDLPYATLSQRGQAGQVAPQKSISSTLTALKGFETTKSFRQLENPKGIQQSMTNLQEKVSMPLSEQIIPETSFSQKTSLKEINLQEKQLKDISKEIGIPQKEERKTLEHYAQKSKLEVQEVNQDSKIKSLLQLNSMAGLPEIKQLPSTKNSTSQGFTLNKIDQNKQQQSGTNSKNILNAFASIRSQQKEETKVSMSARGAQSNALGFFKQQNKEEKKIIQEKKQEIVRQTNEVVQQKVQKTMQVQKENGTMQKLSSQDIHQVQLPKSPYLQNVTRKFETMQSQYLIQKNKVKEESKEKTTDIKVQQVVQQQQQTSPYIGLNRKLTKEERQQHLKQLKKHVEGFMQKGTIQASKKDKKIIPISNAFQLDIKNERAEVIKNMENLRKSVKLSKRANPLEKILNKLVQQESNEEKNQTQIVKVQESILNKGKQIQFNGYKEVIQEQETMAKRPSITKTLQIKAQLQAIIEDQEDDPIQNTKSLPQQQVQQKEIENVEKKMEEIGHINKTNTFGGASPIITFRPLNRVGSDQNASSNNTPIGTPDLRNQFSFKDQNFSTDTSTQQEQQQKQFELQKSQQILQSLQTAKKELDILENLKTMALDIFNLALQIKQAKTRKKIVEQYLQELKSILSQGILSYKSEIIVKGFVEIVQQKLDILTEIVQLEQQYNKTLPLSQAKKHNEEETTYKTRQIQRKVNLSIQAREAPSQMIAKQGNQKRKESGIFQPSGISPRKELSQFLNDSTSSSKQSQFFSRNSNLSPNLGDDQSPHIGYSPLDKFTFTPQVQCRQLNFQFTDSLKQQQMAIPSSLMSLSQVNSPQIQEKTRNSFGILQNQACGLQSIQEEKTQEMKAQQILQQSLNRVRTGTTNQTRQKSQFSNQQQNQQSISNISLDEDSSLSKGSMSSESTERQDQMQKSHFLNDRTHKKSITELNNQPFDNETEEAKLNFHIPQSQHSFNSSSSPLSKVSKNSQLSTFSKGRRNEGSTKAQQFDDQDEKKVLEFEFQDNKFNSDNVFRQRSFDRTGSFKLNVKRAESKSQIRRIQSKIANDKKQNENNDKIECQSDIIIGMNFDQSFYGEDERQTNSDIHEFFFVKELLDDQNKFERMLAQIQINEALSQHHYSENNYENLNPQKTNYEEVDDENEEEILTIDRVRFNSLCILPSQLEILQLDYIERKKDKQMTINDFILLKTVSKGAYGKVFLARQKNTDDLFAIKVLDKQKMVEKNVTEYIMNERDIISSVSNDFIVRGVYAFQSKKYLYMVMEFMKGGDFGSFLEGIGALDETTAKYYLAQIILALDYLHKSGIIHRDMKPENVLIDAEGRIKLTDFGLSETGLKKLRETVKKVSALQDVMKSPNQQQREMELKEDIQKVLGADMSELKQGKKQEENKTVEKEKSKEDYKENGGSPNKRGSNAKKRVLGTADYMAPEVINGQEHTPALDFWSLGVITYEFLTGSLPFNDETPEKVFVKILKRDLKYPRICREEDKPEDDEELTITPEAKDFIDRLLCLDPKKRLGSNGIKEVKEHPFFKDFAWDKIMEMKAPFKPLGREQDATYFPKATDQDEDIQTIYDDKLDFTKEGSFNKFDSICYDTLKIINAKKAREALIRAQRLKKQSPAPKHKQSYQDESILVDMKSSIISMESFAEKIEEEIIQPEQLR